METIARTNLQPFQIILNIFGWAATLQSSSGLGGLSVHVKISTFVWSIWEWKLAFAGSWLCLCSRNWVFQWFSKISIKHFLVKKYIFLLIAICIMWFGTYPWAQIYCFIILLTCVSFASHKGHPFQWWHRWILSPTSIFQVHSFSHS